MTLIVSAALSGALHSKLTVWIVQIIFTVGRRSIFFFFHDAIYPAVTRCPQNVYSRIHFRGPSPFPSESFKPGIGRHVPGAPVIFIRAYLFPGNSNLRQYIGGSRFSPLTWNSRQLIAFHVGIRRGSELRRTKKTARSAAKLRKSGRESRPRDRSPRAAAEDIRRTIILGRQFS